MVSRAHPSPSRTGDAAAHVLPPDVNGVMLENLHAVVGARTFALLDALDAADDAILARGAFTVN